jgi:predicted TIM-barrel fold metal-dependent hydrolase
VKFVFQDGGSDILTPLMYRLDLLWTSLRGQTPWVTKAPSEYLATNVRLCTSSLEGPTDPGKMDDWMGFHDKSDLVMFGSQYPHWSLLDPVDAVAGLPTERRERVMWRTANTLYNLGLDQPGADIQLEGG